MGWKQYNGNTLSRVPRGRPRSRVLKELVKLRDNYTCQYCELKLKVEDVTIDHVQPKSGYGKTRDPRNLVVACFKCNNLKDNMRPEDVGLSLLREPGPIGLLAVKYEKYFDLMIEYGRDWAKNINVNTTEDNMAKIPRKTSRQFRTLVEFINWPMVWILDLDDMTHKQLLSDVAALRQKGWPIEDAPIEDGNHRSRHGYRLDPERWASLKSRIERFW
jgi:hypothetical protein